MITLLIRRRPSQPHIHSIHTQKSQIDLNLSPFWLLFSLSRVMGRGYEKVPFSSCTSLLQAVILRTLAYCVTNMQTGDTENSPTNNRAKSAWESSFILRSLTTHLYIIVVVIIFLCYLLLFHMHETSFSLSYRIWIHRYYSLIHWQTAYAWLT